MSLNSVSKISVLIVFLLPILCFCGEDSDDQWSLSGDALVWYASEEVASIWADVITVGDNTSSWDAVGFNLKWDTGFRLGLKKSFDCKSWDIALYWTWFQVGHSQKIPFTENSKISPEFFAAFLSGNTPQSMEGRWNLLLNIFDWELGWCDFACGRFSVRPFMGLKGGWIDQSIKAHYNDLIIDSIPTTLSAKEKLRNDFWGIGPLFGVNSKWKIAAFNCHCFYLLGDFSIATLYGNWICKDHYKNDLSQTSSVTTTRSTLGALMFQAFLGLEWKGASCFKARLGYESQIWMNQLRIATFQLQRLHNDLTLQGVTFRCICSF